MGSGYKAHNAYKADKAYVAPNDAVRPGSYKSVKAPKAHETLKAALLWLLRAFLRLCRYAVLHA